MVQLVVDILTCAADIAIVIFFIIELRGEVKSRKIREKEMELQERLLALLDAKTKEEIEILEDVHAELADINDLQPEISEEGQNEDNEAKEVSPPN